MKHVFSMFLAILRISFGLLRRLPRDLPPRVCLPYTYVNFNAKSHKTKIEFPSVNFLKFCMYQDITFVNLNTDFLKILLKDFF